MWFSRREVGGRGDHLAARDAAAKVRDLLRPLVDEKNDHVHVGLVDLDGVGHALQERRLSGLRGRHDQAPLPATDGGQQVDDAAAHLVRLGLEPEDVGRIDRDEFLEGGPLPEGSGLHPLDRLDALQDRARAIGDEALDERAGLEAFALDQLPRNQRVLRRRNEVRLCGNQHAGRVFPGRQVQNALGRPLGAGGGEIVGPFRRPARRSGRPAPAASTPAAPSAAAVLTLPVTLRASLRRGRLGRNRYRCKTSRGQGIFGHELPNHPPR